MTDLDKIKDLVGSSDNDNRELGIILAVTHLTNIDKFCENCVYKWFYDDYYDQLPKPHFNPTFRLGYWELKCYAGPDELWGYTTGESHKCLDSGKDKRVKLFRQMIYLYIQSEVPELLHKLEPKLLSDTNVSKLS